MICRRNDRLLDVDNGMRGTVRHVDGDRVVIDTDAGLVRELPAAYVKEHLELAYALTGHGMQGGTVETADRRRRSPATSPPAGATPPSPAPAGQTRLLDPRPAARRGRGEFAPTEQTHYPGTERSPRPRARQMLERDDEDLAIEQLPGAGRADDPALAGSRELAAELPQERAAALAESAQPAPPTRKQLRELGERVEELQAQLRALALGKLQRIEELDRLAITLVSRGSGNAQRLAELPEPRRRFGREKDPHAAERIHLNNALQGNEEALGNVLERRSDLARELGDVPEARAERDGLEHAISEVIRQRTAVREELVERELQARAAWVSVTFGERPDGPRAAQVWEHGVRLTARYRVEHDITDPGDALGPQPEQREQQRSWERARKALNRGARRLDRHRDADHDLEIGVGQ